MDGNCRFYSMYLHLLKILHQPSSHVERDIQKIAVVTEIVL